MTPDDLQELAQDLRGDGFELLGVGDTVGADDEYYRPGDGWTPQSSCNHGKPLRESHYVTRRAAAVAGMILIGNTYDSIDDERLGDVADELALQGYTLLRPGDVVQPGDEYLPEGDTNWREFPELYHGTALTDQYCVARRAGLAKAATTSDETEGDRLMRFFFGGS